MTRREFIVIPAAMGVRVQVRLRFFTSKQAAVIEAACECIIPADESGPGAKEAGVVVYIDRQLAGPYGHDKYRFTQPPFFNSVAEHGYQGKENPRQIYTAGLGLLGNFVAMTREQREVRLVSVEHSLFFQMLRTHTIEGMFCDPLHGGNDGMAGWKMVGFPGPAMSWKGEIDKHFGEAFRPAPKSLVQIAGKPVKGMEDDVS